MDDGRWLDSHGPSSARERLLAGAEAHLWYVLPDSLSDDRLLAAYRALLSPAEIERNGRFIFAAGRHQDLITRALVRTTLSAYHSDVAPHAWQFTSGPYGRPEIAAPRCHPALHFSLSHTDGLIACLVAAEREIGVDVEDTARSVSLETLAERYFSPPEARALRALPPEARRQRFFEYWTLKEAYVKARGLGLQLPLDRFSFHLEAGQPIRISFADGLRDDPASWQFQLLRPTPRHRLALAIRCAGKGDLAVRVWPTVPLVPGRTSPAG